MFIQATVRGTEFSMRVEHAQPWDAAVFASAYRNFVRRGVRCFGTLNAWDGHFDSARRAGNRKQRRSA